MTVKTAQDDRLSLEQQICFALAVASRDVVSLYRPFLEPLGLTHPQYLLMVTLWEHPDPLCVKDLSALLKVDAPTLSPLLKRMEGAGLLSRERNPADERSVLITLTPHGRELRSLAGNVPASIIARLGMSVEELELLQTALQSLIRHANVRSSSSTGPTWAGL
jgi:DNA-binding MarR family transcriptional regulator